MRQNDNLKCWSNDAFGIFKKRDDHKCAMQINLELLLKAISCLPHCPQLLNERELLNEYYSLSATHELLMRALKVSIVRRSERHTNRDIKSGQSRI